MGKILQIRVVAVTWNQDLIEDYWPRVAKLAFSVPVKLENHGVLEMIRALDEGLRFEKWSDERKQALGPGINGLADMRGQLEKALADWEPSRANELSNHIEDALDKLERAFV